MPTLLAGSAGAAVGWAAAAALTISSAVFLGVSGSEGGCAACAQCGASARVASSRSRRDARLERFS